MTQLKGKGGVLPIKNQFRETAVSHKPAAPSKGELPLLCAAGSRASTTPSGTDSKSLYKKSNGGSWRLSVAQPYEPQSLLLGVHP
jgi:hypothetical protein